MTTLLDTAEIAQAAGIGANTVRRLVRRGVLVPDDTRASKNGKGGLTYYFRPERADEIRALRRQPKPRAEPQPATTVPSPETKYEPTWANRRLGRKLLDAPLPQAEMNVVVMAYESGTLHPNSPWYRKGPPLHYYEDAALAA